MEQYGYTFSKRVDDKDTIVIKRNNTAIATVGKDGTFSTTKAFTSGDHQNLAIINNTINEGKTQGSAANYENLFSNMNLSPSGVTTAIVQKIVEMLIKYLAEHQEYMNRQKQQSAQPTADGGNYQPSSASQPAVTSQPAVPSEELGL